MNRQPDIADTAGNGHGERVAAAKRTLTEAGTEIAARARQSARATNDYVRGHPWQAVGIGAILGLLVGIAVKRRP